MRNVGALFFILSEFYVHTFVLWWRWVEDCKYHEGEKEKSRL